MEWANVKGLTGSKLSKALETVKKYYRVDRSAIFFLKFIIEAYDGIAVLETIDPGLGMVVIHIAPGCESDVDMILNDLKKDIMIEPATRKSFK